MWDVLFGLLLFILAALLGLCVIFIQFLIFRAFGWWPAEPRKIKKE